MDTIKAAFQNSFLIRRFCYITLSAAEVSCCRMVVVPDLRDGRPPGEAERNHHKATLIILSKRYTFK